MGIKQWTDRGKTKWRPGLEAWFSVNAEDDIQQPLETTTTLNGKVYTISSAGKVEPTLHS